MSFAPGGAIYPEAKRDADIFKALPQTVFCGMRHIGPGPHHFKK
jgi:hypothetical protein